MDEQLRLKQISLEDFCQETDGWTLHSAQENLEHKRLLYTMRSYLYHNGCRQFKINILAQNGLQNLRESSTTTQNYIEEHERSFLNLTKMSEKEFMILILESADRSNSMQFYKKLVSEIVGESVENNAKSNIVDAIVKNYCVSIL
jgi:hypothetical protein